jgi:intracellular sulfur oxidation DsrE/DsrF family protein
MIRSRLEARVACALIVAAGIAASTASTASTAAGTAEPNPAQPPNAPSAQPSMPGLWVYPLVRGYGGVRPRPDLPASLSSGTEYRILVDVVHGDSNHAQVTSSLVRLARLVNLMAYAGVPRDHVHIAAVIEDMAGYAVLTNEAYRKQFNVDNPNLTLLHELKSSGVELMVCAQALAENSWPDTDVSPDVTVTLSALTDFVVYGQRGYSYLQL